MVRIDISAEPATPPEQGVKVHVRKKADRNEEKGDAIQTKKDRRPGRP